MSDQPLPEPAIPVQSFVKRLKGSADEVYSKLLLIEHKATNKTHAEWLAALDALRGHPAPVVAPAPKDEDQE